MISGPMFLRGNIKVRKVFIANSDVKDQADICPACQQLGNEHYLRYFHVNMDEAVYKCGNSSCMYPYQHFKYKNFADNTLYRYEQIADSPVKSATSATKPPSLVVNHNSTNNDQNVNFVSDDGMDCNASIFDVIKTTREIIDDCSFDLSDNLDHYLNLSSDDYTIDNLNNPYDIDSTIDSLIGDICNQSDFELPLDKEFDYTITELSDGFTPKSPQKSPSFAAKSQPNTSPRLQKCIKHIEDNTQSETKTSFRFGSKSKIKKTRESSKIDENNKHSKPAAGKLIESIPTTPKSYDRIDGDVKPVKKLILSDLLRKEGNLSENLRTLIKHKNNFKPLDVIESLSTLNQTVFNSVNVKSNTNNNPNKALKTMASEFDDHTKEFKVESYTVRVNGVTKRQKIRSNVHLVKMEPET